MLKIISILFIGAGLWACSSVSTISVNSNTEKMDERFTSNISIDSIIKPYRDSLQDEMNEVIAIAINNLEIGRPNSTLGNWVADAVFVNQTKNVRLSIPIFCLLNVGGLRASINKGNVTIGDIYRLMPFDNEIVWVMLPMSSLQEIEEYIQQSGGEPISGAKMINRKLEINGWKKDATHFWVITSDYLMNGGDKMNFFSKQSEINSTATLLRDALIIEAKAQQEISADTITRIKL